MAEPLLPLLIVNADDYGLTTGVSRGIVRAHQEGILTSTSVLAVAPAFASTVGWLDDCPDLGVGAHLAIVGEDPPLLTAAEIPTLVSCSGAFQLSWRQLVPRLAAGRVDPADIEREFEAQLERITQTGVRLTHLDTHQHLHLWRPVGQVVLRLARRWDVPAVRVPRSARRTPVGLGVARLARRLARHVGEAGLQTTEAFAGLDEAGAMVSPCLQDLLARLARQAVPTAEIGLHPGDDDDADPDRARYRWGYRWAEELAALTSPEVRRAVATAGFRLATYGALRDEAAP